MPEFSSVAGVIGRSVYDCPEPSASEIEDARVQRILDAIPRHKLEQALVALLSAARTAEGEALALDDALASILCPKLRAHLDNITDQLIARGIDRVVDLLGADETELLERLA